MTGEQEVATAIGRRLEALLIALDEDEAALGSMPADLAAFRSMPASKRVASRALLKTVEQLQDQLARLFRLLPRLTLADTVGWYAQDHANYAEKLGILADGLGWSDIVRLRNRLVHDYPLEPAAQFDALVDASSVAPVLRMTALAGCAFIAREVPTP